MKRKQILIEIGRIIVAVITALCTSYGTISCTVNSGNREYTSPMTGYPERMYIPRSSHVPVVKTDTVKVIKETNTIYTGE